MCYRLTETCSLVLLRVGVSSPWAIDNQRHHMLRFHPEWAPFTLLRFEQAWLCKVCYNSYTAAQKLALLPQVVTDAAWNRFVLSYLSPICQFAHFVSARSEKAHIVSGWCCSPIHQTDDLARTGWRNETVPHISRVMLRHLKGGLACHSWRPFCCSLCKKKKKKQVFQPGLKVHKGRKMCQTVEERWLNTLWLTERAAAGSHRRTNNCEKFNSSCLSHSECGGLRPERHTRLPAGAVRLSHRAQTYRSHSEGGHS